MNSQTLVLAVDTSTLVRMLLLGFAGFFLSMLLTPFYTDIAYKRQWWKKPRQNTFSDKVAKVLNSLRADKNKQNTPTMAGIIFVVAVFVVTVLANLSRTDTWLPLAAFVGAGLVGLLDDLISIRGTWLGVAGLSSKINLLLLTLIAFIGGWWFYAKLGVDSIHVPLISAQFHVGWLIVPLFVLVVVSTAKAVTISDGLDGLAGGLTVYAFSAYVAIAFLEGRYGIAAFCLTIVGALLSYTWFNIFPARFFMGDVGSFALGTALGVVALLTDTVLILPIIGIVFVAEAGSVVLRIASKNLSKDDKMSKAYPIHQHYEASGWPETKVTMRFWVIGQVAAVVGLAVFIIGRYN